MKTFLSALLLATAAAFAEDFTTPQGKEYKGVTVSRVEPDGIVVTTEDGVVKIRFTDLPAEVGKRYGYDPQKAAAWAAENPKLIAAHNAAVAEAARKEVQRKNLAAALEAMKKTGRRAELKIVQVLDNGILVTGAIDQPEGGSFRYTRPFFVACATEGLTDGKMLETILYEFGTHKYTDVAGGGRTVKAYATSAEDAVKLMIR